MSDVITVWGAIFIFGALAVGAIVGIQRRSGRARAWYVVGLAVGGAIGLAAAWPADDSVPAPWGLMIGVAAAGMAPAVTSAVRRVIPRVIDAIAARLSRAPCGRDREDEG